MTLWHQHLSPSSFTKFCLTRADWASRAVRPCQCHWEVPRHWKLLGKYHTAVLLVQSETCQQLSCLVVAPNDFVSPQRLGHSPVHCSKRQLLDSERFETPAFKNVWQLGISWHVGLWIIWFLHERSKTPPKACWQFHEIWVASAPLALKKKTIVDLSNDLVDFSTNMPNHKLPFRPSSCIQLQWPCRSQAERILVHLNCLGEPRQGRRGFNQLGFFWRQMSTPGVKLTTPQTQQKILPLTTDSQDFGNHPKSFWGNDGKKMFIEKNNWKRPTDFLRITSLQHRHPAAHGLWGKVSHLFADSDLNQKSKRNFLYLFTLTDGPCLNKTLLYSKMRTIV